MYSISGNNPPVDTTDDTMKTRTIATKSPPPDIYTPHFEGLLVVPFGQDAAMDEELRKMWQQPINPKARRAAWR